MPTTPNYSITYPAQSDPINVPGNLQTIATAVDGLTLSALSGTLDGSTKITAASVTQDRISTASGELRGAWQSWNGTPFTNVTGGTWVGEYLLVGKTLFLNGRFSAGTATAASFVRVTLPASLTAPVALQSMHALFGIGVIHASVGNSETSIVISGTQAATNGAFTAGASLTAVHIIGVIEVA